MKRKLMLLCVFCLLIMAFAFLLPQQAQAASTSDLTFKLNSDGESYYVSDCAMSASGALVIPSTYSGKPVTNISTGAFENCTSLTSVTIPDSVTSIGDSAFWGCAGLTSVTIPDSVTSIGNWAFLGCRGLTSVTIPDGVTSIGSGAFTSCSKLTGIWVDANNTVYSSDGKGVLHNKDKTELILCPVGYAGDYTMLNTVTSIDAYAFDYCVNLTSVTIGDRVTHIGASAFMDCKGLTSVTIPGSVTHIGEKAFFLCDSLNSVYISDIAAWCSISFESIEANPLMWSEHFYINGDLVTKLVIPEGVTSISNFAFYRCNDLISVSIPNTIKSIGGTVFAECNNLQYNVYDNAKYLGNASNPYVVLIEAKDTSITSCSIHTGTRLIYDYAFAHCDSLTSITIPDGVIGVGKWAFDDCDSLTSVTLGDGVTAITENTFWDCNSLTNVIISDSIASIDMNAFKNCENIEYNTYNNAEYLGNAGNPYVALIKATSTSVTFCRIHDDAKIIAGGAFYDCSRLTNITIPGSIISIGELAFQGCDSLARVEIFDIAAWCGISFDDSYIDNPLFYAGNLYLNGELVTDLVIPEGVTNIGYGAFEGCTSITSVTIPDGVTSIGDYAFSKCSNLTSVIIPDSIIRFGSYVFADCDNMEYHSYDNAKYLGNTRNPYAVLIEGISEDIFSCQVHNDTKAIAEMAFYRNGGLTDIMIPNGVSGIGDGAFKYCDNLTGIAIPKSITSIGDEAFAYCKKLSSILFKGDAPGFCGKNMFYGVVATAQYPANNATWTSKVKQNYGGYITWEPYQPAPAYNGLTLVDGIWGYYIDGELQTDFTDLVCYEGNFFYVQNGILSFDYTGLVLYMGNYYYVENSVLNWGYTGLTLYNGVWYYVQNGQLVWGYYGLVCHEGAWFYVENSAITFAYTGLVEYMGNWYYVEGSCINWGYSSLYLHNGTWYVIQGGQLIWGYYGLVLYNDLWFYAENSAITFTFTGLAEYQGILFYFDGSCLNWSYNGKATYNGVEYQVVNGMAFF